MKEHDLLQAIRQDLRLSAETRKILYFEGCSDVPIFLALVGITPPPIVPDEGWVEPGIGVLVRGLNAEGKKARGSGNNAVRQRVQVAEKFGYAGVRGIVDGDGMLYGELAACFDAPFAGQLHRWKAYCIENLLAQVGWPSAWGETPDWRAVFRDFLPYAALNRVRRGLDAYVQELGVAKFVTPPLGQRLRTVEEVEAQLAADRDQLHAQFDALALFRAEVQRIDGVLSLPHLDQAHALINGKWLVEVEAAARTRKNADDCRREWAAHVAAAGGHPEVRAWWDRYLAL